MIKEEMQKLKTGDVIVHKLTNQDYVVAANYGKRIRAVKTVDITNLAEWDILEKPLLEVKSGMAFYSTDGNFHYNVIQTDNSWCAVYKNGSLDQDIYDVVSFIGDDTRDPERDINVC